MSAPRTLPDFVPPMLAVLGKRPFDSDEHLFEIKWDGVRALAYVDGDQTRLVNRHRRECLALYPELARLADLPAGTLLDGELVVLRDDRPSFPSVMSRQQARGAATITRLASELPASYVVFDLLSLDFEDLTQLPLRERRARLEALLGDFENDRVVLSSGVVGAGRSFFEQAAARELEGMVAKRLDSRYLAGKRSDAWTKVKTTRRLHAVILGWMPDDTGDVSSLVIGAPDADGALRHVGRVGSGLTEAMRSRLLEELDQRPRSTPLVPCPERARWVEAGLFCVVDFLEYTREGRLRAPVFVDLIIDGDE